MMMTMMIEILIGKKFQVCKNALPSVFPLIMPVTAEEIGNTCFPQSKAQ